MNGICLHRYIIREDNVVQKCGDCGVNFDIIVDINEHQKFLNEFRKTHPDNKDTDLELCLKCDYYAININTFNKAEEEYDVLLHSKKCDNYCVVRENKVTQKCNDCGKEFNIVVPPIDINEYQEILKRFQKYNPREIGTDMELYLRIQVIIINKETYEKAIEEYKTLFENKRNCEHACAFKLPYSGELCVVCNTIIINNDFDKYLTKQNYNDIMKVLASNYRGDITKNPQWVRGYKFVNVDALNSYL